MSNGFYFGMGGVPSVYDEYPDEQPILVDGYELDLDTLTAGGELVNRRVHRSSQRRGSRQGRYRGLPRGASRALAGA